MECLKDYELLCLARFGSFQLMSTHKDLERLLLDYGSVCVGYSGGVDSAFLAVTAVDVLGPANVLAVTGRSESYPDIQWQMARTVAKQFSLPHLEIDTNELSDPNYRANPSNRCYFCKTELWSQLALVARERQLRVVIDGSNADDAHDHRPGAQAAREHDVRSPLQEAGLTKVQIRELSHARGLPTWDLPSAPCLSSRVPYGISISPEILRMIEAAEQVVRDAGIREFRVRYHGSIARLEIAPGEMVVAIDRAQTLNEKLRALGFARVLLDAEGYRRGALNEQPLVQLTTMSESVPVAPADATMEIGVLDLPATSLLQFPSQAAVARRAGFRFAAVDLAR